MHAQSIYFQNIKKGIRVICCNPRRSIHTASNTEFLLSQRPPLCSAFWNSSKGPFISGEIPLGRLDPNWSLERDEALSFWGGSTDSKTLDNQRTNPQFSSVQSCPTLCDPMNRSTPSFPVHRQLPESTQTHAH